MALDVGHPVAKLLQPAELDYEILGNKIAHLKPGTGSISL
jgi:hypothetical protein